MLVGPTKWRVQRVEQGIAWLEPAEPGGEAIRRPCADIKVYDDAVVHVDHDAQPRMAGEEDE